MHLFKLAVILTGFAVPLVAEARIPLAPFGRAFLQNLGGLFEFLVFEQLLNQAVAWIVAGFDGNFFLFGAGQNETTFDFDQRAGHDDKVTGQVEVQELQRRQIPLKLRGDLRDRQVEQIEFVPPNQEQQQVQRAGVAIKLNTVDGGHGRECIPLEEQRTEERRSRAEGGRQI